MGDYLGDKVIKINNNFVLQNFVILQNSLLFSLLGLPFIILSQASIFCLVFEKAFDGKDYLLRPEQTPAVQCVSCFFTVNSFFLLCCIIFFPSLNSSLENSWVYLFSLQLLWSRAYVFCSSVYWAFSPVPRTPKLKGSKGRSIRVLSLGGTEHQNSHCNSSISYFSSAV